MQGKDAHINCQRDKPRRNMKKIAIVGGGVAAMSAVVYAARGNAQITMFAPYGLGGLVATIDRIDNFPSYPSVDGWTLAQNFVQQVKALDVQVVRERVLSLDKSDDGFAVATDKSVYTFDRVIVASGTAHNKLGFETDWVGRGVSYCATCDGNFFRGKNVAVVGGGGQAVREADYLAQIATHVYVVCPSAQPTADLTAIAELTSKQNVQVVCNSVAVGIVGNDTVEGLDVVTDGVAGHLSVSAVFVAVGAVPVTDFVHVDGVLDDKGYVIVDGRAETSVKGLFAAGDVTNGPLKQIVTACSDGAKAGLFALK